MEKQVWKKYSIYTKMPDGEDVTSLEMQKIYNDLVDEYKSIADLIVEAIDRNDYIRVSKLINQRKHVWSASDEMEALYGDKLHPSNKTKRRLADGLAKSTYLADTRGAEALRSIFTGLETVNETVRTAADKAVNGTANTLNRGNRMNYKLPAAFCRKQLTGC